MDEEYIEKDLEWESQVAGSVTYIPVAGASEMANFRSPDSYVFIFFEKCSGWHTVDFIEYNEGDNQVHISFPGQIHSWKTDEGAKGHKLILSKKFVEVYLSDTRFSSLHINNYPVVDPPPDQAEKLFRELNLIKQELEDKAIHYNIVILRTRLVLLLVSRFIDLRAADDSSSGKKNPLISRFLDLIETHFIVSKAVGFYADKLAITPNYLNILAKRELGLTAKELIDGRVVLEAKRQLLGSGKSIKEIAFDLGFSTTASFSTYIAGKTGFYPKNFREPESRMAENG
ncbi:AraC family transcriptional regulator [Niabella beijingensis]|uniref:AraC family transcriptional regulator n=1 Tax=Niabella beijingensis TaxID=2872700 RepID=UPI001CBE7107|nr:helix-turn-helix domain-containing protein [Niabella beijingensis]MBZ4191906.1 helix-turn-helix domain-containing protein [Niabella beijingensis]